MEKFSVVEFQRMCKNKSVKEFIFNSENQRNCTPIRYDIHFENMSTLNEKDILCFKNSCGFLKLTNIYQIEIVKDSKATGMVFIVNCVNNHHYQEYTFIAQ